MLEEFLHEPREIAAASGMFLALDILLMRLRHPVG